MLERGKKYIFGVNDGGYVIGKVRNVNELGYVELDRASLIHSMNGLNQCLENGLPKSRPGDKECFVDRSFVNLAEIKYITLWTHPLPR